MSVNILFAAADQKWSEYKYHLSLATKATGVDANISTKIAPESVDYIVYAPNSELIDFSPYTRAKAILNLWAGVETVVGNQTLQIPLCRMVDPALTQGMVEWVTGHILRLHLRIEDHVGLKPGEWPPTVPPLAFDTQITILGLGKLGTACAQSLVNLGFNVTGWSRSVKNIDGVTCMSGSNRLEDALSNASYCVLLLPKTPQTENTLNKKTLAYLPKGACILNPGRGQLVDDDALLDALQSGQIRHATLDTFRIEPLPKEHPFWTHPNITVTPHVASATRAAYSCKTIAENIRRGEAGEEFIYQVDLTAGY